MTEIDNEKSKKHSVTLRLNANSMIYRLSNALSPLGNRSSLQFETFVVHDVLKDLIQECDDHHSTLHLSLDAQSNNRLCLLSAQGFGKKASKNKSLESVVENRCFIIRKQETKLRKVRHSNWWTNSFKNKREIIISLPHGEFSSLPSFTRGTSWPPLFLKMQIFGVFWSISRCLFVMQESSKISWCYKAGTDFGVLCESVVSMCFITCITKQ